MKNKKATVIKVLALLGLIAIVLGAILPSVAIY